MNWNIVYGTATLAMLGVTVLMIENGSHAITTPTASATPTRTVSQPDRITTALASYESGQDLQEAVRVMLDRPEPSETPRNMMGDPVRGTTVPVIRDGDVVGHMSIDPVAVADARSREVEKIKSDAAKRRAAQQKKRSSTTSARPQGRTRSSSLASALSKFSQSRGRHRPEWLRDMRRERAEIDRLYQRRSRARRSTSNR